MEKIALVKKAVTFVVGVGTTQIVRTVIQKVVEPETIKDRILVGAGSMAIGGMVADATKSYTNRQIDEIVTLWNEEIKPRLNRQ